MIATAPHFTPPGFFARTVNRTYGLLTALGLSPSSSYLLQTYGRKTGLLRSTPVNLLRHGTKLYLVGTRGRTQWSRNAIVSGRLTLRRGRSVFAFRCRELPNEDKAEILRHYLIRFNWMVRRFFPLRSDADSAAFGAIVDRYPVFELLPELPLTSDHPAAAR
jgi:deazaflavin-dependent oxidoreductase (nitroreductase family)